MSFTAYVSLACFTPQSCILIAFAFWNSWWTLIICNFLLRFSAISCKPSRTDGCVPDKVRLMSYGQVTVVRGGTNDTCWWVIHRVITYVPLCSCAALWFPIKSSCVRISTMTQYFWYYSRGKMLMARIQSHIRICLAHSKLEEYLSMTEGAACTYTSYTWLPRFIRTGESFTDIVSFDCVAAIMRRFSPIPRPVNSSACAGCFQLTINDHISFSI